MIQTCLSAIKDSGITWVKESKRQRKERGRGRTGEHAIRLQLWKRGCRCLGPTDAGTDCSMKDASWKVLMSNCSRLKSYWKHSGDAWMIKWLDKKAKSQHMKGGLQDWLMDWIWNLNEISYIKSNQMQRQTIKLWSVNTDHWAHMIPDSIHSLKSPEMQPRLVQLKHSAVM